MLDDTVLLEIGRVTVNAARVDAMCCHLIITLGEHDQTVDRLLQASAGKNRKRVEQLAHRAGDDELMRDITAWVTRARRLGEARNSLVHAEWLTAESPAGGDAWLGIKREPGGELNLIPAVTPAAFSRLADELEQESGNARRLIRRLQDQRRADSARTGRGS